MENIFGEDISILTTVTEIELVYKTKVKPAARPCVRNAEDMYKIFAAFWDANLIDLQEQFCVMFLNASFRVLGIQKVSSGGMTGTVADPRLILAAALKTGAVNIAICHNHPSSNLKPSRQDEMLTDKIKQTAAILEINLIEHIIISSSGYYSFADKGLV